MSARSGPRSNQRLGPRAGAGQPDRRHRVSEFLAAARHLAHVARVAPARPGQDRDLVVGVRRQGGAAGSQARRSAWPGCAASARPAPSSRTTWTIGRNAPRPAAASCPGRCRSTTRWASATSASTRRSAPGPAIPASARATTAQFYRRWAEVMDGRDWGDWRAATASARRAMRNEDLITDPRGRAVPLSRGAAARRPAVSRLARIVHRRCPLLDGRPDQPLPANQQGDRDPRSRPLCRGRHRRRGRAGDPRRDQGDADRPGRAARHRHGLGGRPAVAHPPPDHQYRGRARRHRRAKSRSTAISSSIAAAARPSRISMSAAGRMCCAGSTAPGRSPSRRLVLDQNVLTAKNVSMFF